MNRLREKYLDLLDEICIEWGYCGCNKNDTTIRVSLFVPSSGVVFADQFVEWTLLADDVNPNGDTEGMRRIKKGIRDAFVKHLGSDEVKAEDILRDDVSK